MSTIAPKNEAEPPTSRLRAGLSGSYSTGMRLPLRAACDDRRVGRPRAPGLLLAGAIEEAEVDLVDGPPVVAGGRRLHVVGLRVGAHAAAVEDPVVPHGAADQGEDDCHDEADQAQMPPKRVRKVAFHPRAAIGTERGGGGGRGEGGGASGASMAPCYPAWGRTRAAASSRAPRAEPDPAHRAAVALLLHDDGPAVQLDHAARQAEPQGQPAATAVACRAKSISSSSRVTSRLPYSTST